MRCLVRYQSSECNVCHLETCEEALTESYKVSDNDHPPAYYLRLAEGFDETENAKANYSDATTLILDRGE
jgi:hypothetical protein